MDDPRLDRLEATVDITRVIHTYAARIDAGDFAGVGELFTHARITSEGLDTVHDGPDEVRAMYDDWTRRYPDGTPRTKHVTTNVMVDVDPSGDTASASSYFTVLQQTDQLALQPVIAGRYRDRFARADGGWRFTHRHMITELHGDLSAHMLQQVPRA